jgi:hypothetical protein
LNHPGAGLPHKIQVRRIGEIISLFQNGSPAGAGIKPDIENIFFFLISAYTAFRHFTPPGIIHLNWI